MNNKIFERNSHDNKNLKYFIIAFSTFVIVLALASAFLFMYSIDFDFNNFIDTTEEQTTEDNTQPADIVYSANSLSGKSTVLFVCADSKESFNFAFSVACDFDNKSMTVKAVDKATKITLNGIQNTCADVYEKSLINGLKSAYNESYQIEIDKYFICDSAGAKEILSLFDGITLNVQNDIDYKSENISVELNKGKQTVSGKIAFNYLAVSDNNTREQIICDVINSILIETYIGNSQRLFSQFVNEGETDISIIDYSNTIEKLEIYVKSSDKFLPKGV